MKRVYVATVEADSTESAAKAFSLAGEMWTSIFPFTRRGNDYSISVDFKTETDKRSELPCSRWMSCFFRNQDNQEKYGGDNPSTLYTVRDSLAQSTVGDILDILNNLAAPDMPDPTMRDAAILAIEINDLISKFGGFTLLTCFKIGA